MPEIVEGHINTIKLVKKDGKLIHKPGNNIFYNMFVEGLEDGQEVQAFFEADKDDDTTAKSSEKEETKDQDSSKPDDLGNLPSKHI